MRIDVRLKVRRRGCGLALIVAMVLGVIIGPASAQNLPSGITSATNITLEMQRSINRYAEQHLANLMSETSTPQVIEESRNRLLQPLTTPGSSLQFRVAYFNTIEEPLTRVLQAQQGDRYPHRAVNAIRILQATRTDDALDLLAEHADSTRESRRFVRRAAVRGMQVVLQGLIKDGGIDDGLTEKQVRRTLRVLASDIEIENDPLTRRAMIETIARVAGSPARSEPLQSVTASAREDLIKAVATIIETFGASSDPTLLDVDAIQAGVFESRQVYLGLTGAAQREFGRHLGPLLEKTLAVVRAEWERAREDSRSKRVYGTVVTNAESLLVIVHQQLGDASSAPGNDALYSAWNADNPTSYDRALSTWSTIVGRQPYRPLP